MCFYYLIICILIEIVDLPAHTGTDKIRLKVIKLSNVSATPKLANKFAPKSVKIRSVFPKT